MKLFKIVPITYINLEQVKAIHVEDLSITFIFDSVGGHQESAEWFETPEQTQAALDAFVKACGGVAGEMEI